MEKQTLSRKPNSHPILTRHAVAAARTYATQIAETNIKTHDLDESKTISAEKPAVMNIALKAEFKVCLLVSYLK